MPVASTLHRTLFVALASLALAAPAALARPADARSEAPTSSLSGTRGTVFEHMFDPYPMAAPSLNAPGTRPDDPALAQERYSSSYGESAPIARTAPADPADGIAWLPFVLAISGALILGLGAGSGLHLAITRRRHPTALVT